MEDETGQSQYHGQLEGAQSATYYLLMLQGKEFVAIPAGSWYPLLILIYAMFCMLSSLVLGMVAKYVVRNNHVHWFLFVLVVVYI